MHTLNILLKFLPFQLPAPIRKRIVAELFKVTADAFACPAPTLVRLSYNVRLRAYALFTREQADKVLQSGCDISAIKARLYGNAYRLGARLRTWLGVASPEKVMAVGQILYRTIRIEIQGDAWGNVTVSRCYFSQFYSAPVCDLISALDDGIFSGLSGGRRLTFSERLSEGRACCKAALSLGREEGR